MIARLTGTLVHHTPEDVIIDAGGVGYEVRVPLRVAEALPPAGEDVSLFIHTLVKEDAIELYGFDSLAQRALFRTLIGVSGVGPKLALSLLGRLPTQELVTAILTADVKTLSSVPGVGKKSAERLSVELKDVVKKRFGDLMDASALAAASASSAPSYFLNEADFRLALEALGYRRPSIDRAVADLAAAGHPAAESVEDLIREALRLLQQRGRA